MILVWRHMHQDAATQVLAGLAQRLSATTWRVFNPQWMSLDDADVEIETVVCGSQAVQLSSAMALLVLRRGQIGFDWTDVEIRSESNGTVLCYLQCVDSAVWYAETTNLVTLDWLRQCGWTCEGQSARRFKRYEWPH